MAAATQAQDSLPVYRLGSLSNGDHFYTTSAAERDSAVASNNYVFENIMGYAPPDGAGVTPVYRLIYPATGEHFYTSNSGERDSAIANGYTYEEIGYNVFTTQGAGRIPVFRLYIPSIGKHFYTSSQSERDSLISNGSVYEGVLGYLTAQIGFAFTNISNGDTISGEIGITIKLPSSSYGYGDVSLFVDGDEVHMAGDFVSTSSSGSTITIPLQTDAFSNGSHEVSISDTSGNADTRTLIFSNTVNSINVTETFDPDNIAQPNPDVPGTATIQANLAGAQSWTVTIHATDGAGTVVRTFTGFGSVVNLTWDGTNDAGVEADDDSYEVFFEYQGQQSSPPSRRRINKNRIGDALILLETDSTIFPGGPSSVNQYKTFIQNCLKPFVGVSINKLSFILVDPHVNFANRSSGLATIAQINAHFKQRLQVFYVDCHGGVGPTPFFGIGPVTWYSTTIPNGYVGKGSLSLELPVLMANVGYGNPVDPPALVWIDACHSAEGGDTSFASAFQSGANGYGAFIGYNGYTINYGAWAPPDDCWEFWRRQFWTEFTTGHRNFQTAILRADTFTTNHGFGRFAPGTRPTDVKITAGQGATSL